MPIDDALEKLTPPEKSEKPSPLETATFTPEGATQEAQNILARFLTDFFQGKLNGQKARAEEILPSYLPFIQRVGPSYLYLEPRKEYKGPIDIFGRFISPQFNPDYVATPEQQRAFLITAYGESIMDTDFADLITGQPKNFFYRIPDAENFRKTIDHLIKETLESLSILHPHLFVMGLPPEHRPLTTLTVHEKLQQHPRLSLPLPPSFSQRNLFHAIETMKPATQDFLAVAQRYKIRNVRTAVEEFNKASELYISRWS